MTAHHIAQSELILDRHGTGDKEAYHSREGHDAQSSHLNEKENDDLACHCKGSSRIGHGKPGDADRARSGEEGVNRMYTVGCSVWQLEQEASNYNESGKASD